MTPAVPAELARHAWDFRDAAVAAENVLGERIEYQIGASMPVACLFGVSIELALRSYILAMNPSSARAAIGDNSHDLTLLCEEADEQGLTRLVRIDEYERKMFHVLGSLCAKPLSQYAALGENDIPPYSSIKKLCEKLLEIACATAGYERVVYD